MMAMAEVLADSELTGCYAWICWQLLPLRECEATDVLKSALQALSPFFGVLLTQGCALGYRKTALQAWIAAAGKRNHRNKAPKVDKWPQWPPQA